MSKKFLFIFTILVLLALALYFAVQSNSRRIELERLRASVTGEEINVKTVAFLKDFVNKVLGAQGEIDFDTRLKLENEVRDLKDQTILDQWQKFTASQTEAQAQLEVRKLLEILVDKISTI